MEFTNTSKRRLAGNYVHIPAITYIMEANNKILVYSSVLKTRLVDKLMATSIA